MRISMSYLLYLNQGKAHSLSIIHHLNKTWETRLSTRGWCSKNREVVFHSVHQLRTGTDYFQQFVYIIFAVDLICSVAFSATSWRQLSISCFHLSLTTIVFHYENKHVDIDKDQYLYFWIIHITRCWPTYPYFSSTACGYDCKS